MANARSADPVVRKKLAEEIRNACMTAGFFYGRSFYCSMKVSKLTEAVVKNHGIPEEDVISAVSASEKFFALPIEAKMEVHIVRSLNLYSLSRASCRPYIEI